MSPGIQTRLLAAQSDERLVALVRQGHERAFEAMVHRYRRPLLRYCQRLSLSEARAEDVLQQSLLNAWIALRRGAEVRELRPWLYRIVHNVAVNSMRGEQPLLDIATVTESMPGAIEAAASSSTAAVGAASNVDDVLAVRDAFAEMADLPPMQREVMVRTAVGGHSHEEVASALGISDGAVRGLLYRARAQLRAAIAAVMPPPLIAWAVRNAGSASGGRGAATSERVAEIAGGAGAAGGAGLAGLAMKGGIVAITAGAAITGAVVVKAHHPSRASTHATRHQAVASSASAADQPSTGAPTSPSSPSLSAVLDRSRSSHAGASHRHPRRRDARRNANVGGGGGAVNQVPASQPIYVAPQSSAEPPSGGDRHRSHDHAGGGDRRSSGSSDAPATSAGGDGSHSGDHHGSPEPGSSGSSDEASSQSGPGASGSGSSSGGDSGSSLQQPGGEATQDESQAAEPASGEPATGGSTEEALTEEPATGEAGSDK